ncbi:hypothetical protein LINPERHAP1_LOCUS15347 [Linum perenne]
MAAATASLSAPPFIHSTSHLKSSSSSFSPKSSSSSSRLQPSCSNFSCCGGSRPRYQTGHLKFLLHDALDFSRIDTSHAREARKGFLSQIEKLSDIERETSITINRRVDLGKTALYIAAEDDSLISHSSVPLPVDSFIQRLDDLSMDFCSTNSSSLCSSPDNFLDSLEKYLYVKKGFRRSLSTLRVEPRALYLHSVLTHRSGSAVMLSLIYSEILKMLRLWGIVDFDCEIYYPHNINGLPRGYDKKTSKESDQLHIMTSQNLLQEMLRNLKEAFWPFQYDQTRSLFLSAAHAANCVDTTEECLCIYSGFQLASAKAAQHRLDRGVWTSVSFGDMRRAMSACERLILLGSDPKDLRDYSILLYHCGLYDQSRQYLKLFKDTNGSPQKNESSSSEMSRMEDDAVEKLSMRLDLISMEVGWSEPSHVRNFLGNNSEPW